MDKTEETSQLLRYKDVVKKEQATIGRGRNATDGGGTNPRTEGQAYFGLALSGGGIRSATFNLGILQAMAEQRLLSRVDYLSTVSGGGYIGSWLSAMIHRGAERLQGPRVTDRSKSQAKEAEEAAALSAAALRQMECASHQRPFDCQCDGVKHLAMVGEGESETVSFLRRYSSYLTPRSTFFSLDTLGAVASLMRNLLLNQTILICLLATLLLVPLSAAPLFEPGRSADESLIRLLPGIIPLLLFVASWTIARGLRAEDCANRQASSSSRRYGLRQSEVTLGLILPSFFASTAIALLIAVQPAGKFEGWQWALGGAAVYGLLWVAGWLAAGIRCSCNRSRGNAVRGWFILSSLIAGITAGLMLWGYAQAVSAVPEAHVAWFSISFGTAIVWGILNLAVVLQIGLAKRLFSEMGREWLGRAGGLVLSIQLGWVGICCAALYGTPLIRYLNDWVAYAGGAAWIAHTVGGVLLARGDKTASVNKWGWREIWAQTLPFVFIAGLLLLLSAGIHKALVALPHSADADSVRAQQKSPPAEAAAHMFPPSTPPAPAKADGSSKAAPERKEPPSVSKFVSEVEKTHAESRRVPVWTPPGALVLFAGVCLLLAWRVDINLFSMHQFYRNRLTRCYLGASRRDRNPDTFTDFDPADDLPLDKLKHQRPVHLINGALNLTRVSGDSDGKRNNLDWQERMCAPFVFSPHACGYQFPGEPGYFRPTREYMAQEGWQTRQDGAQLGMAMAVSGAASSPNMGYHTSPALAFVMTFFNVRLGRWCGNPMHDDPRPSSSGCGDKRGAWRWSSPWFGLKYLLAELFGAADDRLAFVNVSDGGHFENLGIYELVRRRCRLIVACDAGQDKDYQFEDLGNAVHKCRVDLGAEIHIDVSPLQKTGSRQRHVVGRIEYGDGSEGVLVYIKPVLCGTEPVDVVHYMKTHGDFPHESTSDQWFTESQFESYRQLGLATGREIFVCKQWGREKETCNDWVLRTADLLEYEWKTPKKEPAIA